VSYIVVTFTDDDFKKHKFSEMLQKKEDFQGKKVSDVKGLEVSVRRELSNHYATSNV
jgi:hypothetical protein